MFKRIFFTFIFSTIIYFQLYSQQKNFDIAVQWDKSFQSEGQHFLYFENAVYDARYPGIPFYTLPVEVNKLSKITRYYISEAKYESISAEDELVLTNLDYHFLQIKFESWSSNSRMQPLLVVSFAPIRQNSSGKYEKLVSCRLTIDFESFETLKTKKNYANHSVLSSGNWYKIRTSEAGLYSVTFDELKSLGISQPANIRIYGNGGLQLSTSNSDQHPDDLTENPLLFYYGSDGIFNSGDYVVFYSNGSVKWKYDNSKQMFLHSKNAYSDFSYYFITEDLGPGKRMETAPAVTANANIQVNTYDDYLYHDNDNQNLLRTGKMWFGESFAPGTEHNFSFRIDNRVPDQPVEIYAHVAARSPDSYTNPYFSLLENNTPFQNISVSAINFSVYYLFGNDSYNKSEIITNHNPLQLAMRFYSGYPSAKGWLDYICINSRRHLVYQQGQFGFRDIESVESGNIAEFQISGVRQAIRIADVTRPENPFLIPVVLQNNTAYFRINTDSLREFICFDGTGFLKPTFSGSGLGKIPNQNLHATGQTDYVIVAPEFFLSYASQLAGFHRTYSNLKTIVVTPEQVYNEFSSGKTDPMAIRLFMKMLYDRATTETDKPRYLLLFGDGSYDNKGITENTSNLLPTYQSESSLSETSSFVSDDFYALLDDTEFGVTGFEDIGVGRFPVDNEQEAQLMVNKILSYSSAQTFGDWRNITCFLADDADGNEVEHMSYTDLLANKVSAVAPYMNIEKIYLDQFQQVSTSSGERYPAVTQAIINRINRGTIMLNYTGHGNPEQLTHEAVLTVPDIQLFNNRNKLTLFVTASCEVSRFDDYNRVSLGEHFLLHPDGGAVALFSTTRLVYSGSNFNLNDNFCSLVFSRDINDHPLRLGDVVRLSKVNTGAANNTNKRNFCLLGDPALKIGIPELNIVPETLNGIAIGSQCDTLKALSKIVITGYIADASGNLITDFSGRIYPTIYDKTINKTTLANDGSQAFTYKIQNSVLYKGMATVSNGRFSFSFIVPKDIQYTFGKGKISCYSENGITDARGSNFDIVIGGNSGTEINDDQGPEISLYLNDEKFINGGITGQTPVLLAVLSDSSGINTTGNGIGHDITATIDNDRNKIFTLNDYYQAEQDSYQHGKVIFPLPKLDAGNHKISFKVWDINNISSEKSLDFTVVESTEPVIAHLFNYPNPFTTHTEFYFEHNIGNEDFDVVLEIFTVTGKMVKSMQQIIPASGYRCGPIAWDGRDQTGDRLGRGVYVYRIKIRTSTGKKVEKFEKLVILK